MKIFSKEEFVRFVRSSDELYIDNVSIGGEDDNFDYDLKVVNKVFDGNGFYSLMFGCRGEVEFVKVDNFIDEMNEWNNLDDDNEFKYMVEENDCYLDVSFDEEDFRCYFLIFDNSWFEIIYFV